MATRERIQSPPEEPAGLDDSERESSRENTMGRPATQLEENKNAHPDLVLLINAIERLLAEKPKPSGWNRFWSSLKAFFSYPLTLVLVSGLVGGWLTHYYTIRQKDIEHDLSLKQMKLTSRRSFSDELNKIRIQKIGEVWEQIDKNEIALDSLLEDTNKAPESSKQTLDTITNLIREDKVVVNKNRFWLGEQNYGKIKEYLDTNVQLAMNIVLASPGTDLTEIIEKRARAKQDILQVRQNMLSEGEPDK